MSNRLAMAQLNSVAIGGLGGSGTRLVAEIISTFGFYIGSSLNAANDNLWFTFLLKRPEWFETFPNSREIIRAVRLFQKAMVSGLSSNVSIRESIYIRRIAKKLRKSHQKTGVENRHMKKLLASYPPDFTTYIGWGWKEPNTHVFLPQIAETLPTLKYIHVIRNGLDMAFSNNQQQHKNWGRKIAKSTPEIFSNSPSASLDFWIAANQRAIDICQQQMPGRFLLLNYDQLCTRTSEIVGLLSGFLDVPINDNELENIKNMIVPTSQNRYKAAKRQTFSTSQLASVKKFGFDLSGLQS